MSDLVQMSARWAANWPDVRPIGHELRFDTTGRWLRIHSLPDSQRYPHTVEETAELLHRHNALIADLVGLDPSNSIVETCIQVVTCSWSASTVPTPRDAALARVVPDARYWQSLSLGDPGFESWIHLWVNAQLWKHGSLDSLLELVANDWTSDVILMNDQCEWLFHPYDGGADILAPSTATRDEVAARRCSWLSKRADGL